MQIHITGRGMGQGIGIHILEKRDERRRVEQTPMEFVELERRKNRKEASRKGNEKMEYTRLKRQIKIHWHWLRQNEDPVEVYKILKIWIATEKDER